MSTLPPKPFNIGDKVECLHNYGPVIHAGGIYTITRIRARDRCWEWSVEGSGIYHRLDRWRLVNLFRRFILAIENDVSI